MKVIGRGKMLHRVSYLPSFIFLMALKLAHAEKDEMSFQPLSRGAAVPFRSVGCLRFFLLQKSSHRDTLLKAAGAMNCAPTDCYCE